MSIESRSNKLNTVYSSHGVTIAINSSTDHAFFCILYEVFMTSNCGERGSRSRTCQIKVSILGQIIKEDQFTQYNCYNICRGKGRAHWKNVCLLLPVTLHLNLFGFIFFLVFKLVSVEESSWLLTYH